MEYVAGKVARYKRIRLLEFISENSQSPAGKTLRRMLRDKERRRLPGSNLNRLRHGALNTFLSLADLTSECLHAAHPRHQSPLSVGSNFRTSNLREMPACTCESNGSVVLM